MRGSSGCVEPHLTPEFIYTLWEGVRGGGACEYCLNIKFKEEDMVFYGVNMVWHFLKDENV